MTSERGGGCLGVAAGRCSGRSTVVNAVSGGRATDLSPARWTRDRDDRGLCAVVVRYTWHVESLTSDKGLLFQVRIIYFFGVCKS